MIRFEMLCTATCNRSLVARWKGVNTAMFLTKRISESSCVCASAIFDSKSRTLDRMIFDRELSPNVSASSTLNVGDVGDCKVESKL